MTGCGAIVTVRMTGVAAAKDCVPACVAVTEQRPAETICKVDADTEHDPVATKTTGSPEVAEADSARVVPPNVIAGIELNVMVCA